MAGESNLFDIPNDWELTTLGEVCRRGGGNIQTGPFGSQLHASDYVPIGVPSIMPVNIGENRLIEDGIARITEADAKRLEKHRVVAGDIVYSRHGDVERRALVRDSESGWICGTGCLKVRLGRGVVDPEFASFFLGHPEIRKWIVRHAVGATMPNLNTQIMEALPFVLPPIAEQKAIAAVLGALDDKIELNRRMNETLEGLARALFQSWFVDFDPVRAKVDGRQPAGMDQSTAALFPDSFEDSTLGPIPKGWRPCTLGDVANNVSITFDFKRFHDVVFINTGDVLEGTFLHSKRSPHDRLPGQAKKSIRRDDILFSEIRPANKRFAYVDFDSSDHIVSTKFMIIRGSKEIHPRLLYRILTSKETLDEFQVQAESRSGTFPQITFASICYLPIVLPPIEIQEAYQRVVSELDRQVKTNIQQSRTLTTLRDTLLPKLLSGEITLERTQ